MLYNCVIVGNSNIVTFSNGQGGGASFCTLYNCTVVGNVARSISPFDSGGLYNCIFYGSIVYYNKNWLAPEGLSTINYDFFSSYDFSCTIPAQFNTPNSFTNAPLFVSLENGDLRLSPDSPCINASINRPFSPESTDLDGNPRIVGGTADLGAYEFQSPTSTIAYFWLQKYNLPQDGSLDDVDLDGDGFNNRDEWIAGTVPNDELSVLRMLPLTNSPAGMRVTWQSASGRRYNVERSANLLAEPAFTVIATNPPVASPMAVIIDKTAVGPGPYFYRVRAER